MTTTVSFEIAKLLKEKKCDLNHKYMVFTSVETEKYSEGEIFLKPTIAEVVCWIYSKYDIWISLIPDSSSGHRLLDRNFSIAIFKFNMNLNVQSEILREDKNILYFNLPENAYETAILYTLKNLIK